MKQSNKIVHVEKFPPEYYSFELYNSKIRMLSYWYQLSEILSTKPKSALEIGIGSGLITSYLRHTGVKVKTVDVNKNLNPDFEYSVLDLNDDIGLYDVVICCRVLHHIDFESLGQALKNIHSLTRKYAVITLPVDEARMYFISRYTSSDIFTRSIKFPLFLKKIYTRMSGKKVGSGLWQINSSKENSLKKVKDIVNEKFQIIRGYQLPEDKSHYMFLLKRNDL